MWLAFPKGHVGWYPRLRTETPDKIMKLVTVTCPLRNMTWSMSPTYQAMCPSFGKKMVRGCLYRGSKHMVLLPEHSLSPRHQELPSTKCSPQMKSNIYRSSYLTLYSNNSVLKLVLHSVLHLSNSIYYKKKKIKRLSTVRTEDRHMWMCKLFCIPREMV